MISFNHPPLIGSELEYIKHALTGRKLSGDGVFGKKCQSWFNRKLSSQTLLTPSCTHALEMAALLTNIQAGDEVIMPSYTFVSTANAFALRGAKIVFVDIRPDTMNLDEQLILPAITNKTKAIVPVHYAGVSCEMDKINQVAKNNNLYVIEDAAQGMMAKYKGIELGTLGHLGTYSFHETKNYTSGGEGGLLIVNEKTFLQRSEIIREKGTNRSSFFRGMIDKYTWVDVGSSYLPSELQAAFLWAQLENADKINQDRLKTWNLYYKELMPLEDQNYLQLPKIPSHCSHNAHMFYIKVKDLKQRHELISYLKEQEIEAAFHYIPLHSSVAGKKLGRFHGKDNYTTIESERLLRLPLWYGMPASSTLKVINTIKSFYSAKSSTH